MLLSLYKFWSPMFKYVKGVFLRANNMYHQSLKCPLNNYIYSYWFPDIFLIDF